MSITPRRYISELGRTLRERIPAKSPLRGLLALSPLVVFLALYLVSSLIAKDFYKIPVASAFLLASIYAILVSRGGKMDRKIAVFSRGAGDKNVLLMIWIFVLAGAFASTAKAIGSIEATVNLTLMILPGKLILAGLFLAACFISMAIGTSVGTIVALVPIAAGIAAQTGMSLAMTTALIVGGAFFGDNLSFISDTTIAATRTQGVSMADKFKANIWLAAPAALIVTGIYIFMGWNMNLTPAVEPVQWVKLIPYLSVIVMAIAGVNVLTVLSIGLALNAILGFSLGELDWTGFLVAVGDGIAGMGDLIIVTMLAGGMLEVIRYNGGIDWIIRVLTSRIRGKRGAELSIAALVALANLCTANNTIAIITTGSMARDITDRFSLDPRKSASILDTFSCIIQGIIPYGAQLLMASGLAGISAAAIIGRLYYPFVLLGIALLSILLRFPRRYA
ncbi:MAG: Na+/H+ antiporter NhaC family protein [Bacteroidales bacterium]|nr:Na+/H+ antiporter NhaC family protein [Bacteroidales bacterium]